MFAYMAQHKKKSFFKSREDVISMFLGLVVVVAVVGFMVNFIEKRKGNIDVPGVSNDIKIDKNDDVKNVDNMVESIVVVKGDSLWKIAVRVYNDGYKWTEIAKANNLENPGILLIGQKLIIPKIESVAINNDGKGESIGVVDQEQIDYVVVRGDSLWKIAVRVYNDGYKWTKIWQDNRNKLNSPDELEIGMKLVVYGKITE